MFDKKSCNKCGKKTSKKNNFCPNCGNKILKKENKEDWGILGKEDVMPINQEIMSPLLGGFSGKMINKMLGSAMKMLEKEMQKEMKNSENNLPKTNFKLMVNGKEVKFNNQKQISEKPKVQKIQKREFEKNQLEKFLNLPKIEPKTNLRRLGDKIFYEIEMPEVKSSEDILINILENSIEIKAVGKKESYFKVIPVNMSITSKRLHKGKLFLELIEG